MSMELSWYKKLLHTLNSMVSPSQSDNRTQENKTCHYFLVVYAFKLEIYATIKSFSYPTQVLAECH